MNPTGTHGAASPDRDEPTRELPIVTPVLHTPLTRRLLFAGIGATVLLFGGVAVASLGDTGPAARPTPDAAPDLRPAPDAAPDLRPTPDGGQASAAPPGRTVSGLELTGDAGTVTVRTADLGSELYRVTPPARSADDDGQRVRLALDGGSGPVDVQLAAGVRWDLRVTGGGDRRRIDLTGGLIDTVALSGGAGRIELLLPRPDGTLAVSLSGGAGTFDVRAAGGAPVRVRLGSGAGQVVLDGESHTGVAAGAVFAPDEWDATGDRVDLDASGGLNQLTVSAS